MAAKVKLPKYVYYKGGGRHKAKTLWFERQGWTTAKFQNQDPTSAEFFAEYASMMRGEREERTLADERDSRRTFRKLIRDANADKPRFANYCVQVMRILMEHAIDIGWTDTNHAKGVKLFPPSKAKRLPWPPALVDEFRKVAGPRELLVFELLLGTGQRIGDVLDMQWHEIAEGGIYVVQNKTGKHLWVPFGTRLLTLLGNTQKQSMFIVTNPSGDGKWTYDGAQKAIIKIRNKIGAEKYDIHSLRYSAASELMMAGCSVDEIAAITGQTEQMVNHYTAAVKQKALANSARAALERTQY
jgi:integrase